MSGRPYVLKESTLKDIEGTKWKLAVLPWGSTEPHNFHLPYGSDTIQSEKISAESARLCWEKDCPIMALPTIPMGANAQQLDFPFTLNLNPSTQAQVLKDVIRSLEHHDIHKFMVLNSHGGNDFRQIIRELQPQTKIFLCTVNWYKMLPLGEFFEEPGEHAGEFETSLMMHLEPDLVRPLADAGPGAAKVFKIAGFREGWAWAPRHWKKVTDDTGVGNPSRASQEKGQRYFAEVTCRLADFLTELASANPDDLYIKPPKPLKH